MGITWKDGKLTSAPIHSKSGLPCKIVYADQTWQFPTKPGATYPINLAKNSLVLTGSSGLGAFINTKILNL